MPQVTCLGDSVEFGIENNDGWWAAREITEEETWEQLYKGCPDYYFSTGDITDNVGYKYENNQKHFPDDFDVAIVVAIGDEFDEAVVAWDEGKFYLLKRRVEKVKIAA